MRLVLLAHAPVLGGSTDLLFQARDYFRRAHDVTVIFGEGAEPMDPRAADAVILPSRGKTWRETMRDYVKLVESFRPDIAYGISGPRELDLFRFLRCVRVRHASSLEQHGFADIPFWLVEYRDYFEACTANTPDASEEVRHLSGKPTFLLPYQLPSLDPSQKAVAIPERIDGDRPIEVAFVSRLERFQKRAHWLPEIVRLCVKGGANLHWHIYGDGPEAPGLRAKFSGVENVTLHGWTARETLYRRLPGHDILFFCSRWEGLPISMVEGMRYGLACVAPDIPAGIRWTLGHGGGWLYRADSARAAANALVEATRDRGLILEKRREALRLSAELFPASLADEFYPKLEKSMQALKFNGNVLDLATAPKFRAVPLAGYARLLRHAAESAAHDPARFIKRVVKRKRDRP
jgi:glycosyltransferase involved in cell wall biosynthesis